MNKKNSYDYEKILILISLMIIFSLSFIMPSIYTNENGYFDNPNDDTIKELENNDLRSQGLTSDNFYDGIGAAWNLTHWANRTDNNLEVSFENNSYDIKNMPLDVGWQGYKLNATIKNLYDERNWVNGTFDCGTNDTWGPDDSDLVQNWTFGSNDIVGYNNDFWGNYFDGAGGDPNIDQTCLGLTLYGGNNFPTAYGYDKYDACWWNTSFTLPRGDVIAGEINLAIYPYTQYHLSSLWHDPDFGSHFSVRVSLNDVCIDDKNLIWLQDAAGGSGNWVSLKLQLTNWLDDPTVFPDNEKNMSLRIQLIRNGPTFIYNEYGYYQRVLFDNVSLIVKAEAKPEQIDLHINQTNYVNDIDWGEGTVEIDGNWNGTKYSWVHANFSSDAVWELDGYDVDFKTDLNLFANKSSPETNYETNAASLGTKFSVSNNSLVNWECYGYTSVPTGYAETEMRLDFPTDVNITWVSYPSAPLTNKLDSCDNLTAGLLIINVTKISATPDGFWKFEALSPNYCEQLNIFKNTTNTPTGNDWTPDNEFISGDYVNITAKISNTGLISAYIQDTKAIRLIRFPNGTIWSEKTQLKSPDENGLIYFDYFQIPSSPPAYEVGEYDVIIIWNNSYSSYGLNETGVIYKKFTVKHDSILTPIQDYYENVYEETTLNLKVELKDPENNYPIDDAQVSLINFTDGIQNFKYIGGGYYLLEDFNVSDAQAGNNTLTINATSPLYSDSTTNITIHVIKETLLTAEEYPYLKAQWNQNFTIHLNFTEKKTSDGISTNLTTNWIGDTHTTSVGGKYNLTCNSSAYEINKIHSLLISAAKYGYESQDILIKIEIVERYTHLDNIFINNSDCTSNKSYNVKAGEFLNITVKFKDNETSGTFINNATVKLIGTDVDKIFNESISFQHYNLTLNSTELGVGVKFLTITAQKDNYTSASELLTITVFERGTNYILYLNETDSTSDPSYQLTDNQLLNITVSYIDTILTEHISGATVDINGSVISEQLNEAFNNYSVLINSTDLNLGVNFLTIYSQKETYEPQSILITIEVIQIETELKLFLDGEDKTNEPSIDVINLETLNIAIKYTTYGTGAHIINATIELSGSGLLVNLSESLALNQYWIDIDAIDLNTGLNFLTVYAQKSNYEAQTILITIQVIDRETDIEIYLNQVNKTLDKSIELPIGKELNITFKYFDAKTGEYINNATVQLIGTDNPLNLTEYPQLQHYSLNIDTRNLDWGVQFLTIVAEKTNYQPSLNVLKITVRQIITNITTESGEDVINIQAGESYTLSIILYDLDFGELIKNATVRYTWELGQGYLTDDDNNGIFEVTLENIPEGTFTITFTILNVSDDYLFERKVITLNVISSPEETLLFQILTIVAIAAFISVTGYFIAYQRVLKYPKPVRKIHKFKKTLKKKKSPDVEILSSKVLLKALYNKELDPVAKLFKGKMKYEQPEKQLELKPSKDELIDTLSKISPEESKKNEK